MRTHRVYFAGLLFFGTPLIGFAQVTNSATVTIADGPDKGEYVLTVPAEDRHLGSTCVLYKEEDMQPPWYFMGSFYPNPPNSTGPTETAATFWFGDDGKTDELNLELSVPVETEEMVRFYSVETRASHEITGKGTALVTQTGEGATVVVEAETDDGISITVDIECSAVGVPLSKRSG